jgi:penicillin-binding protein 2
MTVRRVVPVMAALLLTACSLPGCPAGSSGTPSASGPTPTATPDPNTPEGVAFQFLEAWIATEYETMYGLLAAESHADYPPESFTGIYTSAADTIRLVEVEAEIDRAQSESTPTTARVAYHATYYTASLGAIEQDLQMTLILEGDAWRILWSPQMIFPELVRGNTLDLLIESPDRASIYDRNGSWLVQTDSPTYTLSVIPSLIGEEEDEARMLNLLSRILRIPEYLIQLNYLGYGEGYAQAVAVGDADAEVVDDLFAELYSYDAIVITDEKLNRRNYYNLAPHILGYISQMTEEQQPEYRARGYAGDEFVGQLGLELWAEEYLAGTRGGVLNAYTRTGEYYGEVFSRESQPALNLYTTIDRELQVIVQDAIEEAYRAGSATWSPTAGGAAVIVMDVETGAILAITSYPYFDANVFYVENGNPLSSDNYREALAADSRVPYFNRATEGEFPPGSVFKIITASAALGSGLFEPDTEYTCNGFWNDLETRADWKEGGHGTITLVQAITGSCNPYFFEIGYQTGRSDPDLIPDYARRFGMGSELGIEIPEEPGLVPDPAAAGGARRAVVHRRQHEPRRRTGQSAGDSTSDGNGGRRHRQRRDAVPSSSGQRHRPQPRRAGAGR